jgi:nitroimidazol reductase NimA-like FMN-containing flavoprotein (pyridoxamine 5'-phosphate oxidase superfamily)
MGIELTPAEIDGYFARASTAILCVSREGTAPLALPMWFAWHEGAIYMNTALRSKKVEDIRRNPEVSCLVESGDKYFTLKAVFIIGRCEVNDRQDEVNSEVWNAWLARVKPLYKELVAWSELPPHLVRMYAQPRATLRITPRSITSWDFAKVRR